MQQTQCQDESSDTSAASLIFFKRNLNVGLGTLQGALGSYYTDDTDTDTTLASIKSYRLPVGCIRLKVLTVTVSGVEYPAETIYDEELWRRIQGGTLLATGDVPQFAFARRDTVEIYPTPATAGNTITFYFEGGGKELVAEDYRTGSILSIANSGTALLGNAPSWTAAMVGRYLRIASEGNWYKIGAFVSTSALTLADKFQGASISAATEDYIIGEVPNTPPPTHILPVYFALWRYYSGPKKDAAKATEYKNYWDSGLLDAKARYGNRSSSNVIRSTRGLRRGARLINPNFYPTGMS